MPFSKSVLVVSLLVLPAGNVAAQTYKVGDRVECSGMAGDIIRIQPRAGWDVPFYIVSSKGSSTTYELNCTPDMMKKLATPTAPAGAATSAPQTPARTTPAPMNTAALCRPGAKLDGRWGISWYEVTVLAAPDASGKCKVRFDGYGSEWDMGIATDGLRPRGSGPVTKPENPVADTPLGSASAPAAIADGTYKCHKISPGGQIMSVGTLSVRGGKGTIAGMPDGWTIASLSPMAPNSRGQAVVGLYYRSTAGFNDKLDCVK